MKRLFLILPALVCFVLLSCQSSKQMGMEEGFIDRGNGIRLFYQKLGNGSNTLIVPAGLFLAEDFKQLAGEGRTVIFYDMRNRGRSSSIIDSAAIGIDKDVEDLEAVRQHFNTEKADLIGWSYLGLMVMLYTQQHPQNVNKVVQIGPMPVQWNEMFPDSLRHRMPPQEDSLRNARLGVILKKDTLLEKDSAAYTRLIFDKVERYWLVGDSSAVAKMGKHWGSQTAYRNEYAANLFRHMKYHLGGSIYNRTFDKEAFKKITQPVLTIHGTKDKITPFGGGKQWTEILPNARLVRVEGAGHVPWVENPDLVFGSIQEFLGIKKR